MPRAREDELPEGLVITSKSRGGFLMFHYLQQLVDAARLRSFSEDEREAQRSSFAYDNARIENEHITRTPHNGGRASRDAESGAARTLMADGTGTGLAAHSLLEQLAARG